MVPSPEEIAILDLNAILRDALHRRGTATEVRPYLEAAAAAAAPAVAPLLVDAVWRVLRDVADQDGIDDGDALHTLAANLGRYAFDLGAPGAPAPHVVRGGRLLPQDAVPPPAAAAPETPVSARSGPGGGCAGSLLAACLLGLLALGAWG